MGKGTVRLPSGRTETVYVSPYMGRLLSAFARGDDDEVQRLLDLQKKARKESRK